MKMPSDKRFLVLEGSPRERGLVHGEMLRPMISEVIERLKYSLKKNYSLKPERLIDGFVKETDFIAAVRKLSPHLLDEVEGISEGAGVDFNTIFFLQCMDEQWWWFPESAHKLEAEGCSALGCFRKDESPALLAQNMDIPNMFQGLDVLLHIKHRDSLESYVYTFAGLIALCGVNNRPVGICCNTLIDLNHCTDGYPVAFIVRSVLEQSNLDEAIKFVRGVKHASGQNYTIGGFEEVVSLECSAGKISRFVPYESARRVCHTDHPLANYDIVVPPKKRMGTGTSHVVEPSFGLDRLFLATLETSYERRDKRNIFKLPRDLTPFKVSVFPLVTKDGLKEKAAELHKTLIKSGINAYYDEGGSVGRRYARSDEVGTPLAVTVDYDTLNDDAVTVRDRDTWKQVRTPISLLVENLRRYTAYEIEFEDIGVPI